MQWFEGYAFGRIAQHSLTILGDISLKKQCVVCLDAMEKEAICCVKVMASAKGAYLGYSGQCVHHFSLEMPDEFMTLALSKSDNPIYELELLPIYVAIVAWEHLLKFRHVVFYLDNDAARAAVCKGVGATDLAQRIVKTVTVSECKRNSNLGMPGYLHTQIYPADQAVWIALICCNWDRLERRWT